MRRAGLIIKAALALWAAVSLIWILTVSTSGPFGTEGRFGGGGASNAKRHRSSLSKSPAVGHPSRTAQSSSAARQSGTAQPTSTMTAEPEAGPPLSNFVCVAWRATKEHPDGRREPSKDKSCMDKIGDEEVGYCEVLELSYAPDGSLEPGNATVHRAAIHPRGAGTIQCGFAPSIVAFSRHSVEHVEPPQAPSFWTTGENREPELRGIVMAITDDLLVSAYAAVMILRSHGCALPIEFWSFPGEVLHRKHLLEELIQSHGPASTRMIPVKKEKICTDPNRCFGVKPYAIFHSRFDQVLLLDADVFALRDPTYLFDSPEFVSTGAIFWPDYWHTGHSMFKVTQESLLWEVTGVPFTEGFEQESGQMLIDRGRHEEALHVLMFYAKPSHNLLWEWQLVWGDKDLFRLSLMRLGHAFHMVSRPPGAAGPLLGAGKKFCGLTMLQHDPDGAPLFLHRNAYKLSAAPKNRKRVWEATMDYVSSEDPLKGYRADTWAPPGGNTVPVKLCFGSPAAKEGWEVTPIRSGSEVGALEALVLKFARRAAVKDCVARSLWRFIMQPAVWLVCAVDVEFGGTQ